MKIKRAKSKITSLFIVTLTVIPFLVFFLYVTSIRSAHNAQGIFDSDSSFTKAETEFTDLELVLLRTSDIKVHENPTAQSNLESMNGIDLQGEIRGSAVTASLAVAESNVFGDVIINDGTGIQYDPKGTITLAPDETNVGIRFTSHFSEKPIVTLHIENNSNNLIATVDEINRDGFTLSIDSAQNIPTVINWAAYGPYAGRVSVITPTSAETTVVIVDADTNTYTNKNINPARTGLGETYTDATFGIDSAINTIDAFVILSSTGAISFTDEKQGDENNA